MSVLAGSYYLERCDRLGIPMPPIMRGDSHQVLGGTYNHNFITAEDNRVKNLDVLGAASQRYLSLLTDVGQFCLQAVATPEMADLRESPHADDVDRANKAHAYRLPHISLIPKSIQKPSRDRLYDLRLEAISREEAAATWPQLGRLEKSRNHPPYLPPTEDGIAYIMASADLSVRQKTVVVRSLTLVIAALSADPQYRPHIQYTSQSHPDNAQVIR